MKKLLAWLWLGAGVVCAQSIDGLWDGVIVMDDFEIPFRMELAQSAKEARGSFLDGDVKVTSTAGQRDKRSLHLRFDFYNADLWAALNNGQLEGAYVRRTRTGATTYPFRARRFEPAPTPAAPAASIGGEWLLNTDVTGRPNVWRFLVRQSGAEVTGAILRLDGDTGTLSGKFQDGKLVMSHFSGARPALLEATLTPAGTLEGTLNRKVKFTGARAAEAHAKGLPQPADPSRFTSIKDPSESLRYSFPDLDGRTVSNADERFRGKVVIVNIMGSWCPNCQDEAPFLVELYRKYHDQGLEIVGLSFEALGDVEQDREQARTFVRRHGIVYPVLLAGMVEPGAVPKKLPQVVNFDSYPTSFFIGRDGRVKSVHDGFASPATGEEHVKLKREVEGLVKRLLAEKPPVS
ncbi:MAG: TlpA family protein disulfide reductase [Acidobacteria bacterium]|nr:TlpA family protein disulfide reductase [Acidobacteriota bacterium]